MIKDFYKIAKVRVIAAAARMDIYLPGWHNKIELKTFNIQESCDCIVGQLHGNFYDNLPMFLSDINMQARDTRFWHSSDHKRYAITLGIYPDPSYLLRCKSNDFRNTRFTTEYEGMKIQSSCLTKLWKVEILRRRKSDLAAPQSMVQSETSMVLREAEKLALTANPVVVESFAQGVELVLA